MKQYRSTEEVSSPGTIAWVGSNAVSMKKPPKGKTKPAEKDLIRLPPQVITNRAVVVGDQLVYDEHGVFVIDCMPVKEFEQHYRKK